MIAEDGRTIVTIIPLYDGARFIERSIRSVLSQSRPTDEFIVVDDGSRDGGLAIVERLARDHPIRLLRKSNGGQSSARNFGVAQSRSSLIAFLDQDDVWYPDHLAALETPFAARQGGALGWSYADLDEGDANAVLITTAYLRTQAATHPKISVRACVGDAMFVLPSAALIAREAFEAVEGFDERLSGYEDDDLFLRILLAGYANIFVDRPLSMWCIYGASASAAPAMARSRMIYARKLLAVHGSTPTDGGTLASAAIAPRFAKNLLGEYARAGGRGDRAAMQASLDDLRTVILPHLRPLPRFGLSVLTGLLSSTRFGQLVTGRKFIATVRRAIGTPPDRRAGG